ncbi:chemotaxis protein CheC [Alicyclobacillus mali]|uniref:Chemotaxis protein CheC n=1 Tax=Alicyclobacillus mali (ex Roth et al. 2021) TaxID=1123961 RepID=A0ABS0F1R9_9BACL|nr:chemotaxis protein CheC [Alicyclobacillus mali (ex Roth et al. 2021)]MBF8377219.1 chemotaxis protein CheC [Alicyclobacillus mali (ex Roth et al. 2021)]MCL6488132.1 chemotaxis protein CheC [Alicyclobacillus mali (ex Roth et al. 2021)]
MNPYDLSAADLDALREFGNIGAGHAATAFSTLLGGVVRMSVTDARLCPFGEVVEVVGGSDTLVIAVYIRIEGEIEGNMFVVLSPESAERLLNQLIPGRTPGDPYGEMEYSALGEVGNILSGAYVAAISDLCGFRMTQSIPAVAMDMASALLDIGLMYGSGEDNQVLLISTRLTHGGREIQAYFFLLPDFHSSSELFDNLRGKMSSG